jgi:cytochrome subunit of sulfide dehydrogenase
LLTHNCAAPAEKSAVNRQPNTGDQARFDLGQYRGATFNVLMARTTRKAMGVLMRHFLEKDTKASQPILRNLRWNVRWALLCIATVFTTGPQASELAQVCMDCHGWDGVSNEVDIPSINGMSRQYLISSMAAYWEKSRPCPTSRFRIVGIGRPSTDMCRIARELNTKEVEEVAAYFSSKAFVRIKQKTDPEKVGKGRKIHMQHCNQCHVNGGTASGQDAATLAGQRMEYLRATFQDFSEGSRDMPIGMETVMNKLDSDDDEALVHFYGSLHNPDPAAFAK